MTARVCLHRNLANVKHIADDPDVAVIQDDLLAALADVKRGKLARETQVNISPIAETRRKAGLSQRLFAERLGISINTLKSWEQGKREPSGSAITTP